MVIGIIGVLAAVSVPVMRHFRPGYTATVTKQLLDDLARARQLAISQRTTVYMVFVRSNFWNEPQISPCDSVLTGMRFLPPSVP